MSLKTIGLSIDDKDISVDEKLIESPQSGVSDWSDGAETDCELGESVPVAVEFDPLLGLPTHGWKAVLIKINWIFPMLSALFFLGTQLGLILYWVLVTHKTVAWPTMHQDQGQTVAYLSDIGANEMKPLFITGFTLSAIFFSTGMTIDRWAIALSLPRGLITKWQRIRSIMMVVFVWIGSAFLVMMTALDTTTTHWLHIVFLFVFFIKYAGLAMTFCFELFRHGYHAKSCLSVGFWFKTVVIVVELALGVADGVMMYTARPNQGAIIEWVLAFIFFFFALSFCWDFWSSNMQVRRLHAPRVLQKKPREISQVVKVKGNGGSSSRTVLVLRLEIVTE